MKIMVASDIHGSALYCRKMLDAFEREQADRLLLLGDLLYHGPRNDSAGRIRAKGSDSLAERSEKPASVRPWKLRYRSGPDGAGIPHHGGILHPVAGKPDGVCHPWPSLQHRLSSPPAARRYPAARPYSCSGMGAFFPLPGMYCTCIELPFPGRIRMPLPESGFRFHPQGKQSARVYDSDGPCGGMENAGGRRVSSVFLHISSSSASIRKLTGRNPSLQEIMTDFLFFIHPS